MNDLPILILSAKGDPSDKISGFIDGVDDYMTKPFNLEEFMLRIKRLLTVIQWQQEQELVPAGHSTEQKPYSFGQNRSIFPAGRPNVRTEPFNSPSKRSNYSNFLSSIEENPCHGANYWRLAGATVREHQLARWIIILFVFVAILRRIPKNQNISKADVLWAISLIMHSMPLDLVLKTFKQCEYYLCTLSHFRGPL